MIPDFPSAYDAIVERVATIDPVRYAKSRNFIHGSVSYLSPYISRGVISLPMIKESVLKKYSFFPSEKFIQELAWREYYQRVWQHLGDTLFTDIKQPQPNIANQQIPTAILNAQTGINGIDNAIQTLYQTGYMHNHARMYTSMLCCNMAASHWLQPAQWMYYHLLDGDLASNALSWQWVCGSFSSKKYYANQENINTYTNTQQQNTFLDHSYEAIAQQSIPNLLSETTTPALTTRLPNRAPVQLNTSLPLFLYNSYQLDPLWHKSEEGNRVLLLEPSHFAKYPVSEKVLNFIIELALTNIPGIQVFCGELHDMKELNAFASIHYKEHPTTAHYTGIQEPREWMFPEVTGYFPSFFGFWKKCEKYLR